MDHKAIVDILDVLYTKLMRLKTAHRTCLSFIMSPDIKSRYSDIVYSIKYSFAVDAYTTLNAMITSGKYSFLTLKKENALFCDKFVDARAELKRVCPNWQERRNSMFCHCNEKQSEDHINEIILNFDSLLQIFSKLHGEAMRIFSVENSEIRIMSNEKFTKLDAEFEEFVMGLQEIATNRFRDELNEIIGNAK